MTSLRILHSSKSYQARRGHTKQHREENIISSKLNEDRSTRRRGLRIKRQREKARKKMKAVRDGTGLASYLSVLLRWR